MNRNIRLFILQVFLIFPLFFSAQSKSEYIQIINSYEQWKNIQFKNGNYATEKNCNPDSVTKEGYKGSTVGIPNDIHVSFTNINEDDKLDAIITFNPQQCDGGNALMNAQIRVLILSTHTGYINDVSYIDKIESQLKKRLDINRRSSIWFFLWNIL